MREFILLLIVSMRLLSDLIYDLIRCLACTTARAGRTRGKSFKKRTTIWTSTSGSGRGGPRWYGGILHVSALFGLLVRPGSGLSWFE